jgi:putative nucleotidyltransferase with HDIG domain
MPVDEALIGSPEPAIPPEPIAARDADELLQRRYADLTAMYAASGRLDATLDWDALLHEILKSALHLARAELGSLMLIDERTGQLYIAQAHNLPEVVVSSTRLKIGEGVAGWVAEHREGMLLIGRVNDKLYPGFFPKPRVLGSSISAPIHLPGAKAQPAELYGVINLSRRVGAVNLSRNDLQLIVAFCSSAAMVMRNARYYRTLQRRANGLQHQAEISHDLINSLDMDVVLQSIMDKAVGLLGCESGSLLLVDEANNELVFKVVVGPASSQLLDRRIPSGAGIAGSVVKDGKPLIVNDAKSDPRHYEAVDSSTTLLTSSLLCVPLIAKDRVIGAVEVVNKKDGTPFDADDQEALTALALQSALALSNARLYSDLKHAFTDTVRAIANAQEARDPYTAGHTNRVTHIAMELARVLNWTRAQSEILEIGALLHDIGKIGIIDSILRKPAELTMDEYVEMKQHPVVGAQMLKGVTVLRPMLPYILFHQERYDGLGYPFGLAGQEIPLEGRLLAVADTFDAITSDRPYRKALSIDQAIDEIVLNRGTQFDPHVVDALLELHANGKLMSMVDAQMSEPSSTNLDELANWSRQTDGSPTPGAAN